MTTLDQIQNRTNQALKNAEKRAEVNETQAKVFQRKDKIISIDHLYKKEFPPEEWIIDKLIPAGGVTILSGPPASYKTWLLLKIAQQVSSKEDFLSEFATEKTGVLIIDEENHQRLIQNRSRMLQISDTLNIHFMNLEGFKATNKAEIEQIIEFSKEKNVGLVIIDSLTRIHTGDENSSRDMSRVFENLRKFCKENISILITHHERKEGLNTTSASNRLRGSSDIHAAIDSLLTVSRQKGKNGKIIIEQAKNRSDEQTKPFAVGLEKIGDNFEILHLGEADPQESRADEAKKKVVNVLTETSEGLLKSEIKTILNKEHGIGQRSISSAIDILVDEGKVEITNEGRNSQRCFLV